MYDLARSCQELQEKCLIFSTEKTQKKVFLVQKTFQEKPRILSRNPRKSKKRQESCQEIRENARNAKNIAKSFKRNLTNVNENKQKPTPTSA